MQKGKVQPLSREDEHNRVSPAPAAAGEAGVSPEPVVSLRGIGKSFGGIRVLSDIDLDLYPGEVLALVGENGAGKSTLGKIIGGYYPRDGGSIRVMGREVEAWDPNRALDKGIAMIHQELSLVPALSVARNVFLGNEEARFGVLKGKSVSRFKKLNEHCKFELDPRAAVSSLRIADMQKVEVMRALAREARVIIMDEPTSSLTADETEKLHAVISWLKGTGCSVVYVTHFLEHALAQSDRITILRDGTLVRTTRVGGETKRSVVEAMLGHALDITYPPKPPRPSPAVEPILEVEHLATDTGVKDVSFFIRPGEIVGLLGLVGSGRSETARAVFGADPPVSGRVLIQGRAYGKASPKKSCQSGLVMIPEDRRNQGLVLQHKARPNISLPHLGALSRWGVLKQRAESGRARDKIKEFGVQPPDPNGVAINFSGGNQQKILLAKWLLSDPRIVLLDEPTRGVDVGARRKIYDLIVQLAAKGAAVLVISSELEEVLGMAHRGYLIKDGRTVAEIDADKATVEEILFELFEVQDRRPGQDRPAAPQGR